MNRRTRFTLAAASLILFGCKSETVAPPPSGPSFAVSDGAHSGNPDFFFLPPMFKNPNTNPNYEPAAFDPNLRPAVEICLLGAPALDGSRECVGAPITRFEPSQISVSLTDQQYQVNWRTDLSNLNVALFYRIQVLVGARVVGFADVDPVVSLAGKGLQNLQTAEFIPLVDGRTLPIKFRLESGVLCAADGTPCNSSTVNLNTGGTIELLGAGEDFKVDIPAGTTATFNDQPVTDVTFNLEVCPKDIDVDLPTFGPCLRVSTYFSETGTGTLEFTKPIRVSMCVLNSVYHTVDETRQQGFITLHQQDGTLIQALPHAEPNCDSGTIGTSGWGWLRDLAERFLAPSPAHAATRTALLHVGAGGETTATGSTCPPASPTYAGVPGVMMSTTCPPSSPTVEGSGPERVAMALISPPRTVSDFQFALPAMMDYLNRADANRTAPPGTSLLTAVRVIDRDSASVAGARVNFFDAAGNPIGTAVSNDNGVAQISWTISAGSNTAIATGRGIAAQNNYPNAMVKPFMPDISLPTNEQSPVALGTGRVTFTATGTVGGSWSTTGSLTTARQFHAAVALPNGAMILGGVGPSFTTLASVERYDTIPNAFVSVASMLSAREQFAAVALPNDVVLAIGGLIRGTSTTTLASAELYDPGKNSWQATGDMITARWGHTATWLADGRVLVTGGNGSSGTVLASAEVYDATTNVFTAVGNMAFAREGHTATLLAGGKVLIAGGFAVGGSVGQSELFDPATGTFANTGTLNVSRHAHTATALYDGTVLLTGGVHVASGVTTRTASAEIYNPATGTFVLTGAMAVARIQHGAARFWDGTVLIAGGEDAASLASAELYNPASGTFTSAGSMATARARHTVTMLPTYIPKALVVGGQSTGLLQSAEVFTHSP